MSFEEIIKKLQERDESVTRCFFFGNGYTIQRINEIRRTNPKKASLLKVPICHTCKPVLLATLHKLYGNKHFNYDECISDFYLYLIQNDKFKTINEPNALMGWIAKTAYYFFLHKKEKEDKLLEKSCEDSLDIIKHDILDDHISPDIRAYVIRVIDAMQNRIYANILNDVVLEVAQYEKKEKIDKMKEFALKMNIPIDNLYAKISLAKKKFKETAIKLEGEYYGK